MHTSNLRKIYSALLLDVTHDDNLAMMCDFLIRKLLLINLLSSTQITVINYFPLITVISHLDQHIK